MSVIENLKNDLEAEMHEIGRRARAAALVLANTPADAKAQALKAAAAALRARQAEILDANAKDMSGGREKGLTEALLDRLELTPERIEGMAKGLEDIAAFPDPVGKVLAAWDRPNGLKIERVSVPLGVTGIIYESRPNVTADAAGLSLKAGNAAILRGGSESFHSAGAILSCMHEGLKAAGLPEHAVQRIPTTDRDAVGILLRMNAYVDVIIPRGGRGLIERVMKEASVPVMAHLDGLCHTYIHAKADPAKAREIAVNAKMRRVSICGATETLLIDKSVASELLPPILDDLKAKGCELRGDEAVCALDADVKRAGPEDWDTEYLAPILSIKTVEGLEEAISFINAHGSHHTEAIITEDAEAAETFMNGIDAAILMVNASTQFADGAEFGMGAEIGISTGKLHARGPVGAAELTSYKYKVRGTGQIRP